MFELKIITRFAAAHQLTMVGEKCENLHGHNWKIEVCIKGKELDQGGVLVDFGIIKQHVKEIIDAIDHQFLNELPFFKNRPASSENIAYYIATEANQRLALAAPGVIVSRVSAWESEDSCATYFLRA